MNPEDQKHLFKVLADQTKTLNEQTNQLRRLELGMYGDEKNGVRGIIERVTHIEKWITNSKLKIAWLSGGVAVVVVALKMAWEWIVEHARKL